MLKKKKDCTLWRPEREGHLLRRTLASDWSTRASADWPECWREIWICCYACIGVWCLPHHRDVVPGVGDHYGMSISGCLGSRQVNQNAWTLIQIIYSSILFLSLILFSVHNKMLDPCFFTSGKSLLYAECNLLWLKVSSECETVSISLDSTSAAGKMLGAAGI